MKRNIQLVLLFIIVSSMVFIAVPSQNVTAQTRDNIKIGALGPLAITPGEDMKNGAELAVDEINNGAGVDVGGTAYNFELITETTSGTDGLPDPVVAGTNLGTLIQTDQVVAVLGGFRTEVVLGAVQPTINTTHTPFLGVGSTAPLITEYFYRVGPVNGTTLTRNIIAMYATLLGPLHNVSSVVIAREDQAWSAAITSALVAVLPSLGITVDNTTIAPIPVTAGASDIATSLNALADDQVADAILTLFSAPVGKTVTEQWAATGLNENYYLAGINVESQRSTFHDETEGAATGEIELESAIPGVYPTAKSEAFVTAYEAAYNKAPTYTAYASYDAVYILKDAIERADSFTSADIHSVLPDTDYVGAATRYKFTSESSAGQVASDAVPASFKIYDSATVHDLWTTSTVGVPGFPYSQPYFGQWLSDGSKAAIWAGSAEGYEAVVAPPYTSDDGDDGAFLPGFEFQMVSFAFFIGMLVMSKRRKNTKI